MDEFILPSPTKYVRGLLVRADFLLKVMLIIASAAATAAIVEEGYSQTTHKRVCDSGYPSVENRRGDAPRICNNGLATAITSIFFGTLVLQIEVIRPCLGGISWKRLVLIVSLGFEAIITLLWGLSSALLMDIYWEYCKIMEDNGMKCGSKDQRFVSVPILGFICAGGWFMLGFIAVLRLIFRKY